jgi:hypothetical protein
MQSGNHPRLVNRYYVATFGVFAVLSIAAAPSAENEPTLAPPSNRAPAAAPTPAEAPAAANDDLASRIEDARHNFKPVSEDQVSDARAELQKRMKDVESYIQPSSKNGERWMRYLHWADLKDEVASQDSKNLEPLDTTLGKLNRNVSGLERRQFRRLARALRRYRDTLAISTWPKPDQLYNRQLDALVKATEAYHKEPSPQNAEAVARQIRIIDSTSQAPEVVEAVRRDLAQPNAFVNISTDYIAAGANRIDRCDPVTDCILGTNIHGTAHTLGRVKVLSIPSDDKAVLEFRSNGDVNSQDVGFNGPAVIHSTSYTNYSATKRVEFSDPEFKSGPAWVHASTDSHVHSIAKQGGGLGSRLVSRIGWRKASQQKGQVDAIASNHAASRIQDRLNDEVRDRLAKTRERYEDEYRRPLERTGDVPDYIHFSSTKTALALEIAQATRSQLGATEAPPEAAGPHDMTARLHESAVNNYLAALLAGATATQNAPEEDIKFNVDLPSWMNRFWKQRKAEPTNDPAAKAEPFVPLSLTLNDRQPITANFDKGKVALTLHIADMQAGDNHFSDWRVTGTYTTELADGKAVLHRDGKLEVLPEDFNGRLDATQTAQRNNLQKDFDKRSAEGTGFPETLEFDPVRPEGELADAGKLGYDEFSSGDGWAVVGMDRLKKQVE